MTPNNTSSRLDSIDALRGFDMMFITGGAALIHALYKAWPCGFMGVLDQQMNHMTWDGFAFYDMIFPLFLFIAGLSFPFSLAKSRAKGVSEWAIVVNILRRMATLVVLGWIFNGILKLNFAEMRYVSVLGRIGVAWGIAALIYRVCGIRMRAIITASIVVFYGGALFLLVAPDAPEGASSLSMEGNIVGYIDRMFLPGKLLDGQFDPLGLLSTLPAVATALLGMFAGDVVRQADVSPARRVMQLTAMGIGGVVLGLLLDLVLPINKPLWSASYVCFAGGLSALLFALFYWVIDVRGWKRWSMWFRVIGMNAITIYMMQKIVDLKGVRNFLFGGLADCFPTPWGKVVLAVGYLLIVYVILKFLYDRKIFLKV